MITIIRNLFLAILGLAAAVGVQAEDLSPQDYMEIEQLYAQYNWAIDNGEAEAWADTFTEDGSFNGMSGREALEGFIQRWVQDMDGANRVHWNSNLRITGDGETAEGGVYLMLLDTSSEPASVISTGTYEDKLVKTEDGWRFSERRVVSGE